VIVRRATFGATCGAALALAVTLVPGAARAQSNGAGGLGQFREGYGGARSTTSRPTSGAMRDANGTLLVVNGLIQAGASSYSSATAGASAYVNGTGSGNGAIGGASAIGNSLNVVVQGNHNTVIVNSTQVNNGAVTAGTELNGNVDLDDQ
jgi:holdfast attachment protein HfaA